jgi:hypothetical protein
MLLRFTRIGMVTERAGTHRVPLPREAVPCQSADRNGDEVDELGVGLAHRAVRREHAVAAVQLDVRLAAVDRTGHGKRGVAGAARARRVARVQPRHQVGQLGSPDLTTAG